MVDVGGWDERASCSMSGVPQLTHNPFTSCQLRASSAFSSASIASSAPAQAAPQRQLSTHPSRPPRTAGAAGWPHTPAPLPVGSAAPVAGPPGPGQLSSDPLPRRGRLPVVMTKQAEQGRAGGTHSYGGQKGRHCCEAVHRCKQARHEHRMLAPAKRCDAAPLTYNAVLHFLAQQGQRAPLQLQPQSCRQC